MRQGGESDISHAVGLLNVNYHLSYLLQEKKRCLSVRITKKNSSQDMINYYQRDWNHHRSGCVATLSTPLSFVVSLLLLFFKDNVLFIVKCFQRSFDCDYSKMLLLSGLEHPRKRDP